MFETKSFQANTCALQMVLIQSHITNTINPLGSANNNGIQELSISINRHRKVQFPIGRAEP